MGWVRFGGRIGLLFLGLAAVASLAFTSDAANRCAVGMPACRMCIIPMCIIPVSLAIAPTRGRQQLPCGGRVWRSNWRWYEHHNCRCSRARRGRHFHRSSAYCGRTRQT